MNSLAPLTKANAEELIDLLWRATSNGQFSLLAGMQGEPQIEVVVYPDHAMAHYSEDADTQRPSVFLNLSLQAAELLDGARLDRMITANSPAAGLN